MITDYISCIMAQDIIQHKMTIMQHTTPYALKTFQDAERHTVSQIVEKIVICEITEELNPSSPISAGCD